MLLFLNHKFAYQTSFIMSIGFGKNIGQFFFLKRVAFFSMNQLQRIIHNLKMRLAFKWIEQVQPTHGLVIVRMEEVAETLYIVTPQGQRCVVNKPTKGKKI